MNTTTSVGLAALVGTTVVFSGTNLIAVEDSEILRPAQFSHVSPNLVSLNSALLVSPSRAYVQSISAQEDSRWIHYVSRRLAQLRHGEGDFTGLQQPSHAVIESARSVAKSLFHADTPAPSVVPSEDGEIRFFWHKSGWMLEIVVGSEEVSIWAHQPSSGDEWSGSLADFRPQVSDLLESLARQ
jgi:hypothetical protein